MTLEDRKLHFAALGNFLSQFGTETSVKSPTVQLNEQFFDEMEQKIDSAVHYNGWFTRENVIFSLQQWSKALTKENLDNWLDKYSLQDVPQKTVGIVMAGNIPLVGFHDFLSVVITGHTVLVKQSRNDQQLLPLLANYLIALESSFKNQIRFTENKLEGFDAVIATGSNNTARYFEFYFGNKPHIIRKNRNSVAVLTGNETHEELLALSEDIFRYYGLGCRNVSKLYVPKDYNFDAFFKAMYHWNPIINQAKYSNNYDYNKAVYLMSEFKLLENGFLILKEDESFGSPIGTLFYEKYDGLEALLKTLEERKDQIQCIVGKNLSENAVDYGKTQQPELWDYADDIDTVAFLVNL